MQYNNVSTNQKSKQLASWRLPFLLLDFWLLGFLLWAFSWPGSWACYLRGGMLLGCGFFWRLSWQQTPRRLLLGHLSGRLTEKEASRCTSAFGLLQAGVLYSSAEGQLSRELTALSSAPTEKFFMKYWRDEPPLFFKLEMVSLTISLHFW